MKTGFVICSRLNSSRVPEKPLQKINGIPLIEHLVSRCIKAGYPVYLAIPGRDYDGYKFLKDKFGNDDLTICTGHAEDPLARMHEVAVKHELDTVIRVCHDKLFVDPVAVKILMKHRESDELDYVTANFVDGASFEVISATALARASDKFKNVEHISYAIQCVTDKIKRIDLSSLWNSEHRLLVDYPEDLKVLNLVMHSIGNDCSLTDAIRFMDHHSWITKINRTPRVTVYTCAYNAEKWITKCMGSVSSQQGFSRYEYLLIDDSSSDATSILMSKFCDVYKNSKWIRNEKNIGLSSSSNEALKRARGRYIIRLDADDYFTSDHAIEDLILQLEKNESDAVYPDNYFGSFKKIQTGNENHHVGGTLFRTRAANHVKFTDGLRGYEGLDFFSRAKDQLKISYFNKPTFFYRQHSNSMSKTNLEERDRILQSIMSSTGSSLIQTG